MKFLTSWWRHEESVYVEQRIQVLKELCEKMVSVRHFGKMNPVKPLMIHTFLDSYNNYIGFAKTPFPKLGLISESSWRQENFWKFCAMLCQKIFEDWKLSRRCILSKIFWWSCTQSDFILVVNSCSTMACLAGFFNTFIMIMYAAPSHD